MLQAYHMIVVVINLPVYAVQIKLPISGMTVCGISTEHLIGNQAACPLKYVLYYY